MTDGDRIMTRSKKTGRALDKTSKQELTDTKKKETPLPDDKKVQYHQQIVTAQYSGPLPDPTSFGKYESILPGSAERILTMAEKEQQHRHQIDDIEVKIESRDSLLGIICGTALGIGGLIAGSIVVVKVPGLAGTVTGLIFGVSGIGSIAITVIQSTRTRREQKGQ